MEQPDERLQIGENSTTPIRPKLRRVEFALTREELREFLHQQLHQVDQGRGRRRPSSFIVLGGLLLLIKIVPLTIESLHDPRKGWASIAEWDVIFLGIGVSILCFPLYFRWLASKTLANSLARDERAGALMKQVVTIGPEGLENTSEQGRGVRNWEFIERIAIHNGLGLFYYQPNIAFIVPVRAFSTDKEAAEFFETARQYHRRARPEQYIAKPQASVRQPLG